MAKGSTESKGKRLILQLYRGIQTYISSPAVVSYRVLTTFSISLSSRVRISESRN